MTKLTNLELIAQLLDDADIYYDESENYNDGDEENEDPSEYYLELEDGIKFTFDKKQKLVEIGS